MGPYYAVHDQSLWFSFEGRRSSVIIARTPTHNRRERPIGHKHTLSNPGLPRVSHVFFWLIKTQPLAQENAQRDITHALVEAKKASGVERFGIARDRVFDLIQPDLEPHLPST